MRDTVVSKYVNFGQVTLMNRNCFVCAGYGNLAPQSEVGKVTTIIYAIIGMPLFLLYLSNIGDIFAKSFKWTYAKCCLCQGCCEGASRRRSARRQQMALQHGAFMGTDEWRVSTTLHRIVYALHFALYGIILEKLALIKVGGWLASLLCDSLEFPVAGILCYFITFHQLQRLSGVRL
jgi:hypothetical protein